MNKLKRLTKTVASNYVEVWTSVATFVGLPVVAWLYFDYRAGILTLTVVSSIVGILALRSSK